ncbi:POK6 protein, partial [Pachyramphus minor]|nr:POK6 protein [Pachyramphus minor]
RDVIRHWFSCFATLGVPKHIKTDNGPAYISAKVKTFLTDWGISHSTSVPHSPTGQAIAERAHRT